LPINKKYSEEMEEEMMNTTAADSEVTSAAPWWIPYFEFFVEGILLVIVASFGIVGRFA